METVDFKFDEIKNEKVKIVIIYSLWYTEIAKKAVLLFWCGNLEDRQRKHGHSSEIF